jgi:hypothetical protein
MRLTRSQQTTEIDPKIAVNAVHSITSQLPSRTSEPEDLLPAERVALQEHDNIRVSDFVTTPFKQLNRKYKQKGDNNQTFKIGDTVEIKSSARLPVIAVVVSLHQVEPGPGYRYAESGAFQVAPFKATVHRFELAGSTRVNRTIRDHVPVSSFV